MNSSKDLYLSEVHMCNCPPGEGLWMTPIYIHDNDKNIEIDDDGDFVIEREKYIIEHNRATTLNEVGTQVKLNYYFYNLQMN